MMSGGSYNYLFLSGAQELLGVRHEVSRMANRLRELGIEDFARLTEDVLTAMLAYQHRVESLSKALERVWHDVEWLDSADIGLDSLMETVEKERSAIWPVQEPQMEKPEQTNCPGPSGPCSGASSAQGEDYKTNSDESTTPPWCKAQGCQDPRGNSPSYCKVCPQFHNWDGTEVPDDEGWGLM